MIYVNFLPWIEIPYLHKTINGIDGRVNNNITFGKPIILYAFFGIIAIGLFSLNKIWAKRTNIFICFITVCLAIKNYILFSICRPECPVIKVGLYAVLFFAIVIQIMALLPKIKLDSNPT